MSSQLRQNVARAASQKELIGRKWGRRQRWSCNDFIDAVMPCTVGSVSMTLPNPAWRTCWAIRGWVAKAVWACQDQLVL